MKFRPPSDAELERMKQRRTTEGGISFEAARAAAQTPRPDVLTHHRAGSSTLESGGQVSPALEQQLLEKAVPPGDDLGGQGPELPEQFAAPEPVDDRVRMHRTEVWDAAAKALAHAHERLRAKGAHPNSPSCQQISDAHKGLTGKAL